MSCEPQYRRQARLLSLVVFSFVIPASSQTVIYVDTDAAGSNDGSSWANAFVHLQDALASAEADDEIWVAEGIYRPDQGTHETIGDRSAAFNVGNGVSLFGGFEGTESHHGERDWLSNATILSGDLLGNDAGQATRNEPTRQDNSEWVIRHNPVDPPKSVEALDGFEIRDGHGGGGLYFGGSGSISNTRLIRNNGVGAWLTELDGQCPSLRDASFVDNVSDAATSRAGGVRVSCPNNTTIRGTRYLNNSGFLGGGLYNGPDSKATLVDALFVGNTGDGAAIYNKGDLVVINARILGNGDESYSLGGGIQNEAEPNGLVTIVNTVVAHNRALRGGGIYVINNSFRAINSVIAANHAADSGGGIWFHANAESDSVQLDNSIIWGNTAGATASQIHHGSIGGTMGSIRLRSGVAGQPIPSTVLDDGKTIDDDPLFNDIDGDDDIAGSEDDDFSLQSGSPAVDAGSNEYLPSDFLDLDGDGDTLEPLPVDGRFHLRVYDGGGGVSRVDIGAFELGAPPIVVSTEDSHQFNSSTSIGASPNPASATVKLHSPDETFRIEAVELFDISGRRRLALRKPHDIGSTDIDVRKLARGVYFGIVSSGDGRTGFFSIVVAR